MASANLEQANSTAQRPALPAQRPALPSQRPLPQGIIDHGHRYTLAQRIQCLTLLTEGFTAAEVEEKTGVKERSQRNIKRKAFERGFQPEKDPRILEAYVIDSERSGRPKEITEEMEQGLLASVRSDRSGREKSSEVLAYEAGISYRSALRILKKHGFHRVKPTTKPGLSPAMKKARLAWCLERQHWTLEDWKNVIFSDETSVILGHRRGGRVSLNLCSGDALAMILKALVIYGRNRLLRSARRMTWSSLKLTISLRPRLKLNGS